MRKKTIWTVAAGTTAAVLVPGVAYALVAGGSGGPQEGPGVVGGEKPAVQPAEGDARGAAADAGTLGDAEAADAEGTDRAPHQLPAVEEMASSGSAPSPVSAVSPLSAASAAPAPQQSNPAPTTSNSTSTEKAPAPATSADSAPSPVSPPSAVSADTPESPDSAD